MKAIGVIEIKTISKGYLVSDGILDLVSVEIVMAQPICPGKFVLIIAGGVAEVENAVAFANREYGEAVVDSTVLGRIEEEVYLSLMGAAETAQRGAVGIIETFSIAAIIQAADTAVKTSGVEIMEIRIGARYGRKMLCTFHRQRIECGRRGEKRRRAGSGGRAAGGYGSHCQSPCGIMAIYRIEVWKCLHWNVRSGLWNN